MRKIITIAFSFLIFMVGCSTVNIPDETIEKDKMVEVLIDLHLADAVFSSKGFHDRNLPDKSQSYYSFVYKKHNVTKAQIDTSLFNYAKEPKVMTEIYDKVTKELKKRHEAQKEKKDFELQEEIKVKLEADTLR